MGAATGMSFGAQLGLGAVGTLAGAGLAYVYGRRAAKPTLDRLDRMASVVRTIEPSKHVIAVPVLGNSETASLAVALNHALSSFQDQFNGQTAQLKVLESVFRLSPNGVLICDADGRLLDFNPACAEMFELGTDVIGSRASEVIREPEVQAVIDSALKDPQGDHVKTIPGNPVLSVRAVVTEDGRVIVLVRDITQYRAAERARTEFVANISHELRTPVAAIMGYAETLSLELERMPPEVRPLVEALNRNGKRLRDTFEGLMKLARLEARLAKPPLEDLRMEPLIIQAVLPAVDAAGMKNVRFSVECPSDVRARVNAEAVDVMLANLAKNAVRYTDEGQVRVLVGIEQDWVRVDVVDTGRGIEPALQDRIFERFFRVDDGRATTEGGVGIGLSMVKHLAFATGAQLSVESQVGEGSTFSIRFPKSGPIGVHDGAEE